MIDPMDLRILAILQEEGRLANAEIARRVGLAPSAVFERVRKLEASRLIRGYHARLDPHPLKRGLLAFIFVTANEAVKRADCARLLAEIPETLEVHNVAGEDCYLVKVRVESPEALGKLLREKFGAIPQVTATRSTLVLETYKETIALPLPAAQPREPLSARESVRTRPSDLLSAPAHPKEARRVTLRRK